MKTIFTILQMSCFLQPILGDANLKLQMFPERFAFTWSKANGKCLEKQDKTWKRID